MIMLNIKNKMELLYIFGKLNEMGEGVFFYLEWYFWIS